MAVEYLIHAGHENIGGIFKSDDGQGHLRYSGYVEGLMKNNLKIRDENIVWIDTHNIKKHHIKDKDILERFTNCTAVVCYNDEVAFQLVDVCLKNNIKIPEDLSIISIDNSDLCMLSEVHLTSIAHPMGDLGKKVAENLIKMIENEEFDGTYEFTPVIVERDSVKSIHKRGVFTNEQI
jgi:GntR family transcriptional regulator of arabinose operon